VLLKIQVVWVVTLLFGEWLLTLQRIMVSSSTGSSTLLELLDPEDTGITVLQTLGTTNHMMQQHIPQDLNLRN
jgi:hypothetical protein